MTNPINTSGGTYIDGNANVGNDFVNRDKNIYYITVVGNLLSWAQVEGLIPKVEGHDFSSVAQAVESSLNARLEGDLIKATAFAGEILSNFVNEWFTKHYGKPIPLAHFVTALIDHVGHRLEEKGYWEAYALGIGLGGLPLYATTMLYQKNFRKAPNFGIQRLRHEIKSRKFADEYNLAEGQYFSQRNPKDFDANKLRIITVGIILDLIRIYSDNEISVQFLQQLSDQFKAK